MHCLALSALMSFPDAVAEKAMFRAYPKRIEALAVSPCGKYAACANLGYGEIHVWSIAAGKYEYSLGLKGERVGSLSFSPDGKYLAACSYKEPTRIWDLKEKKVVHRLLDGVLGGIRVAYSPDGSTIVTGEHDLSLNFWNPKTGRLTASLGSMEPIRSLAFAPDGKTLAVGGTRGGVQFWDVKKRSLIAHLPGYDLPVTSLAFHPKEPIVVSGGTDGKLKATLIVWNVTQKKEIKRIKVNAQMGAGVHDLCFLPDGRVASVGVSPMGAIYDLSGKAEPVLFANFLAVGRHVAATPDGKLLVTGAGDGYCKVWEVPK